MTNITAVINRFQYLIDTVPEKLMAIDEAEFGIKPSPAKWSRKEILGHLIDSAANNHHRFIRTQYENVPVIFYDQDKWNELNYYQQMNGMCVINFWRIYNEHLVEVVKMIPTENLSKVCNAGEKENVTLWWLIADYVRHMEHHLNQIVEL